MIKKKGQKKRKKLKRINKPKKKLKTDGISLVLFSIFLLGIFAETVRTLPAGASNEYYRGFFDNSKTSPDVYDDKLAKTFLIKKTPKIDSKTKETLVLKDKIINEDNVKIAKLKNLEKNNIDIEIKKQEEAVKEIVNISEIEKTIKIAADTSASKIIVDGEEILIPGSSEKNITYLQILQKPNDLDFNLK